jgi:hypothetical protein
MVHGDGALDFYRRVAGGDGDGALDFYRRVAGGAVFAASGGLGTLN